MLLGVDGRISQNGPGGCVPSQSSFSLYRNCGFYSCLPRVWLRPLPVRVVARLARGVSTFATSWPVRRSAIPIAGLGCFLSTLSTFRDSHRRPRVLPRHSTGELATSSFRDSPRGPWAPSQPSIEPAPRGIGIVPFFDGRSFPPKIAFNIRMRLVLPRRYPSAR